MKALNDVATDGLKPGLTLVLDVPESRFEDRMQGKKRDRLEDEGTSFQARVREGYRALAREDKAIVWIDADRDRASVHADILRAVARTLKP